MRITAVLLPEKASQLPVTERFGGGPLSLAGRAALLNVVHQCADSR